MVCLTALYGHPTDPAAFYTYYVNNHLPVAMKLPGLKGYTYGKLSSTNPEEKSPYFLSAYLYFDNMEAVNAAFASPEGQAAVADVAKFATGGITLLTGEQEVAAPVSIS